MPKEFDIHAYISTLSIQKKSTEDSFTSTPSGDISISRLIENKSDYFIKPNPDTREVKKTIILADWSISSYISPHHRIFYELIKELQAQHFNIVVLQNENFVALEDISQLKNLAKDIPPVLSNDIKKQAVKKLRKPIDELHVVDFQEMQQIFYAEHLELQNAIPLTSLAFISVKPDIIAQFNDYFLHIKPESLLDNIICIPNTHELDFQFIENFPMLEKLPRIVKPEIMSFDVTSDDASSVSNLFMAQLDSRPELRQLENLKNISQLQINYEDKIDDARVKERVYQDFLDFVRPLSVLEKVELPNGILFEQISDLPPQIKFLQIDNINSNICFKNNPNLCDLSLVGRLSTFQIFRVEDSHPGLTSIDGMGLTFNLEDFKHLPHLKKLDLLSCQFNGIVFDYMPSLKSLKLERCSCSPEAMKQILKSQEQLEELYLSCGKGQPAFPEEDIPFPKLEKCTLFSLPSTVIKKIIDNAPKLKLLNIILDNSEILPFFDISNLNELSIQTESFFNIYTILQKGQNLERLTIKSNHLYLACYFDALPLFQLKQLHIGDSFSRIQGNVCISDFLKIIGHSQGLEEIGINKLFIYGIYNSPISFPNLKKISLNSSNIENKFLENLIEPTSKIETLSLQDISSHNWALISEKQFPRLYELNIVIKASEIDYQSLELFLKCHPHIQKINIRQGKNTPSFSQEHSNTIEPPQAFIELLKTFPEVNFQGTQLKNSFKRNSNPQLHTSPSAESLSSSEMIYSSQSSSSVDANTTPDPSKTFNLKEFFRALDGSSNPHVASYRLQTFDTFAFGSISSPFQLQNSIDLQWDATKSPQKSSDNVALNLPENKQGYFYGAQKIQLTQDWQALPSLFPDEIMTHFHTYPDIQDIEIQYSKRDNLYYIRSHIPQIVDMDFLIYHPQQPIHELPKEVSDWVKRFNQFGEKALENPPSSPEELLEAIMTQKVGACRHRAVAFKHQMDLLNIPCRIIFNDCHAYAEVQHNRQWHACQLGGYAAELNITPALPPPTDKEESTFESSLPVRKVQMEYPSEEEIQYRRLFKPEKAVPPSSLQAFIQGALQGKQLIHVDKEHIQPLGLAIQKQALDTQHPVFYIDSPDDLICSARVFKRQSNQQGHWQQPGGLLYEFIQENKDKSPVFIINYAKFSADDIARISNSLYDKTASADGVPLPEKSIIVGLSDPTIGCTGADFYSRFDKINDCPKELSIPTLPIFQDQASEDCVEINLFNSPSWKTKLFGGWKIEQSIPHFIPGALENALQTGKTIKIVNPPIEDPEFDKIWTQARLSGQIRTLDSTFIVPKDLTILTEQRPFLRNEKLNIKDRAVENPQFLNPSLVANFFNQYTFTHDKLSQTPGIIELHQNQSLNIQLTRDLTDETWNEFFATCEKFNVTANIMRSTDTIHDWEPKLSLNNASIVTKDIDLTLSQIPDIDDWVVIDASELKASDLIKSIKGSIQDDAFIFQQHEQALIKLLHDNKNVILKGSLTNDLIDELVPFLHQRPTSGKLLLVTERPICGLPSYEHRFQRDNPLSFIEEKTRQERGHDTYKGLDKIASRITLPPFNPDTSEQDTQAFIDKRKNLVMENLAHQPYVFIAGLTGVGKSRFIESELSNDHDIFLGNIQQWAKQPPTTGKMNILFIDEANLSPQQWSEFEGLFQKNPGIVIDGEYINLSPNHKVIFAGNPLSYGDDRKIAPLFARHGNAIIFEPLSPAFIYEKVVKDILGDKPDTGKILLDYYQFVTECSEKEVLITPRQVQMMATLIKDNPQENPHIYAQQICRPLVPENRLKSFNENFPAIERSYSQTSSSNFCNTPSRLPYQHQILDFLKLQQHELDQGLNRLVLEGEAGIGKTEMVIDLLVSNGYTKNHPGDSKTFYHIPASMNYTQKKETLLKAFDEGAIVLIDEINSVATMEKLLNNLLDNKHPEGNRPPKNSGFRLIGTQNPPEYAGRNIDSPALASRTIAIKLETYPHHEMVDILQSKGLNKEKAEPLVKAFEFMRKEAIQNREQTIPSFRDLVKKAEALIQAHQKTLQKQNAPEISPEPSPQFLKMIQQLSKEKIIECLANQPIKVINTEKAIRMDKDFFTSVIGTDRQLIAFIEQLFEKNANLKIMPSIEDINILNILINAMSYDDLRLIPHLPQPYFTNLIQSIENDEIYFDQIQQFASKYVERIMLLDYSIDEKKQFRFHPNPNGIIPNLESLQALSELFKIDLPVPMSLPKLMSFCDEINNTYINLIHSIDEKAFTTIQSAHDILASPNTSKALFEVQNIQEPQEKLEKPTKIYAHIKPQFINPVLMPKPNLTDYKIEEHELQEKMSSPEGIKVYAPTTNISYNLRIHATQTKAVLKQKDIPEKTSDMHIALTIMNMLENIICHKNHVKIRSKDEFMLGVAKAYLDYLNEKNPELNIQYKMPSTSSTKGTDFFNNQIAPKLDYSTQPPPWLEQALSNLQSAVENQRPKQ
ncbi:MAG: hypothetical protein EBQ95_03195 [Gammaproteobacteria bacterium]|nr:hypothetical protein [Gammaproteobacteria bacterium]